MKINFEDLSHIWYYVSEYQTPLWCTFETFQEYWFHSVKFILLARIF